jgi:hypothetical protein
MSESLLTPLALESGSKIVLLVLDGLGDLPHPSTGTRRRSKRRAPRTSTGSLRRPRRGV